MMHTIICIVKTVAVACSLRLVETSVSITGFKSVSSVALCCPLLSRLKSRLNEPGVSIVRIQIGHQVVYGGEGLYFS